MKIRRSERELSLYAWPTLMLFHRHVLVATVGWRNLGSLGWQRNCSNASSKILEPHCLAQLTACATRVRKRECVLLPQLLPDKMLNWTLEQNTDLDQPSAVTAVTFSWWGSRRGLLSSASHQRSSDNVCVMCSTAQHSSSKAQRLPRSQPPWLTPQTHKYSTYVFSVFTEGFITF